MAKLKVECAVCGKWFLKSVGEINRSLKRGNLDYCSRSCTATFRNKLPDIRADSAAHISQYHGKGAKNPNWKGGVTATSTFRSRENYPERHRARNMVTRAITSGRLVRPKCCNDCGAEAFCEAHHEDYSKPLTVAWVCKLCHDKRDAKMRAEGRL